MKKAFPRINVGDPQVVDCPRCEDMHGYQYTDNIKGRYTCFHSFDGSTDDGQYSDSIRITKQGTETFCCHCGSKLPMILNR